MRTPARFCLGAAITGVSLLGSSAQAAHDGWEHTVAVYMVGSALQGTAGVGEFEVDVDLSFSDILDNLDSAAMFVYFAERGPWSFSIDLAYLSLDARLPLGGPLGRVSADAEVDQMMLTVDTGYALNEQWSVYGGARYWDVDTDLSVATDGGGRLSAGASENWVDPIVGLRYMAPIGGAWTLLAKADIGGFGVGSDFSWAATAAAIYQINPDASLLLGYRHIDVDYEDGNGLDKFKWDVWEGGPTVGFAWQF